MSEQSIEVAVATERGAASRARCWLKRVGVGGFFFFFVKGLLWLIVPAMVAYLR